MLRLQLLRSIRHCTEEIPPKAGLFRKRLHVFVTSFKRQNDATPSDAITDVTFDNFSVVNDVKAVHAFRTVTMLFHITRFFNIGCIGEVCSN